MSGLESAEARKTRALILKSAEKHFKRYGHAKTTIVDIARDCAMSHANVYRFFRDKSELMDAVAEVWLKQIVTLGEDVSKRPLSAEERLTEFVLELHRWKKREQIRNKHVHELLAAAALSGRPCIDVHEGKIAALLAAIVEDGNRSGEFSVEDAARAGSAIQNATLKFCHPFLVEQYQDQDLEAQARFTVAMLVNGLKSGRESSRR